MAQHDAATQQNPTAAPIATDVQGGSCCDLSAGSAGRRRAAAEVGAAVLKFDPVEKLWHRDQMISLALQCGDELILAVNCGCVDVVQENYATGAHQVEHPRNEDFLVA